MMMDGGVVVDGVASDMESSGQDPVDRMELSKRQSRNDEQPHETLTPLSCMYPSLVSYGRWDGV